MIVAVPLAVATHIEYEPMLPVDRAFLHRRMPSGSVYKISVVYDNAFWRAAGLCGQSAAPGSPATLTIDACTDTGTPGIMCVITEGPAARKLGLLDPAARKAAVIAELGEHPHVHKELLRNTIEVVTGICENSGQAMEDLAGTLGRILDDDGASFRRQPPDADDVRGIAEQVRQDRKTHV